MLRGLDGLKTVQKEWCISSKRYHSDGWLRTEQTKLSLLTSQLHVLPIDVF